MERFEAPVWFGLCRSPEVQSRWRRAVSSVIPDLAVRLAHQDVRQISAGSRTSITTASSTPRRTSRPACQWPRCVRRPAPGPQPQSSAMSPDPSERWLSGVLHACQLTVCAILNRRTVGYCVRPHDSLRIPACVLHLKRLGGSAPWLACRRRTASDPSCKGCRSTGCGVRHRQSESRCLGIRGCCDRSAVSLLIC